MGPTLWVSNADNDNLGDNNDDGDDDDDNNDDNATSISDEDRDDNNDDDMKMWFYDVVSENLEDFSFECLIVNSKTTTILTIC